VPSTYIEDVIGPQRTREVLEVAFERTGTRPPADIYPHPLEEALE
jgi:hypothetical protein